ncbi:cytochrome b5 domain-containing protein [bacterium]|nr:MAG: cytochrome b5 domain-containing protein [bacterium]
MKKLSILVVAFALLAAGCNSTETTITQDSSTNNNQSTEQTATGYTMADVSAANSGSKCYSAINGSVYDLTEWIPLHPGGAAKIQALCGKDGSSFFNGQHGGQAQQESALAKYKIGTLQQ